MPRTYAGSYSTGDARPTRLPGVRVPLAVQNDIICAFSRPALVPSGP